MTEFIRKNELVCFGTFKAVPGQSGTASAAEAVLVYVDTSGETKTDQIPLTADANGVWWGAWDSSVAGDGEVGWMIHCWGGLKAATEGRFRIKANAANKV